LLKCRMQNEECRMPEKQFFHPRPLASAKRSGGAWVRAWIPPADT
jgi:hypothetical protein